MDKENKTASFEEQFTEANRNEKISEVFNSLGTAIREFTTVIMNACMKERLSDRFVWLWYGEPEMINPSTPWKHYTEVLDDSGSFILTDEELKEYRSQLKKWEKGLLDEKVLKSYLTSSLETET